MKETAIIYCRKSTDREDRQINSLEHQLSNCTKTAKENNLVVLDTIKESISAKTGGKRSGFNRMIQECSKGRIDYIIIDEIKRLSRNIADSALVIGLLDSNSVKGIITTNKRFESSDISAKFMLLLELGISKMDNEHRSADVSAKMITALKRGQWLSKAIFGYKNVTIKKGHKDIKVVESEADIVVQAFTMRARRKSLKEIADFITQETGNKWNGERVSKMIKNTRYYGLQKFGGHEGLLDSPGYRPIISKDLFDKANGTNIVREYKKDPNLPRYFAGIVKDNKGNNLYAYMKKQKYIYYHSKIVNISEKLLFKAMEEHIEKYNFPKPMIVLAKARLKDYYKDKLQNRVVDLRKISTNLSKNKELQESLLEKFLDNCIDKGTYQAQKLKYSNQIELLKEKKKALEQGDDNVVKIIEDLCELLENLSETYKNGDNAKKGKIIKSMQCELFVNKKKELTIKENKLFEIVKSLNNHVWYSHGESNSGSRNENPVS